MLLTVVKADSKPLSFFLITSLIEDEVSNATDLIQEYIAKIREMKQSWDERPPEEEYPPGPCLSLLSALVDLLEIFTKEKSLLMEAKTVLGELVEADPVRRKYWRKRESGVMAILKGLN